MIESTKVVSSPVYGLDRVAKSFRYKQNIRIFIPQFGQEQELHQPLSLQKLPINKPYNILTTIHRYTIRTECKRWIMNSSSIQFS